MTLASPSRARRPRIASATAARRRGAHRGPVGVDLDAQAAAALRTRAPGGARSAGATAQLVGRPADEVRQRHLRLLDLRVPALLPLEGDPAVVARALEPREDARGREVARPGRTGGHGILPSAGRRSSLRWTWRRSGPRAETPASGSSPNSEKAFAGSHTTPRPLASRLLEDASASRRRSRSRRASRARPRRRCRGRGRAARRATRRSSRASTRGRRPAARDRRRRECPSRRARRRPRPSAPPRRSPCAGRSRRGVEEGAGVDAGDGEARVGEAARASRRGRSPRARAAPTARRRPRGSAARRRRSPVRPAASRTRARLHEGQPRVEKERRIMSSGPAWRA